MRENGKSRKGRSRPAILPAILRNARAAHVMGDGTNCRPAGAYAPSSSLPTNCPAAWFVALCTCPVAPSMLILSERGARRHDMPIAMRRPVSHCPLLGPTDSVHGDIPMKHPSPHLSTGALIALLMAGALILG